MRRILILASVLLAVASTPWATTVEELTLNRSLELASDVVMGVVVDSETLETPAGAIFTHWTLLVQEPLKGDTVAGELVVIRHWGGIIGDVGMRVEGVPSFEPNERLLLFLTPWRGSPWRRTLGLFQGAYSLVEEQDGHTWAIQKPSGHTLVVRPQPPDERLPRRMRLDAFLEAIRAEGVRP